MSDSAYKNALAKKERLIKELDEVNSFLKLYQRFAPKVCANVDTGKSVDRAFTQMTLDAEMGQNQSPKQTIPERFRPIIRDVLVRAGRPLPLSDLLGVLSNNGTPVPGEKPAKNLGTILWRLQKDFINLEGYGYWVREKPVVIGNRQYWGQTHPVPPVDNSDLG
jgi:hypothetical protein